MAAIHAPQHVPQGIPQLEVDSWDEPRPAIRPNVVPLSRRDTLAAAGYRRRRLVVLAALAAALVGIVIAVEALARGPAGSTTGTQVSDGPPSPIAGEIYVVQPGDNLWSIAARLAPGDDPRPIVRELRERHGGVELNVGDRVAIEGLGD
jgi:hypothetical protein